MYESPIDVFVTQMNIKINRAIEKEVLTAVQGVGVNVNKEELEKALQYDRGQYKKGYADGVKEFAERLKAETKGLLGANFVGDLAKEMVGAESG